MMVYKLKISLINMFRVIVPNTHNTYMVSAIVKLLK